MTKFTPGPWDVRTAVRLPSIHGGDDKCVASTGSAYNRSLAECEANARLISAAPELYVALREARERMMGSGPAIVSLIKKTDAAIAKAEGRS